MMQQKFVHTGRVAPHRTAVECIQCERTLRYQQTSPGRLVVGRFIHSSITWHTSGRSLFLRKS